MPEADVTQEEAIALMDSFRNEEQFQQWVINAAVQLGWDRELIYHTRNSRQSTAGFPDLILAYPQRRRLIFAELKMPKRELTQPQYNWLRAADSGGAESYIWRPADMDAILEVLS